MAHLRAEFWALPHDGEDTPLPDLRKWSVSPQDDEAGLVELDYPEVGRGFDLLAAMADEDVDLEVEVTISDEDGRTWMDHAILDEADLDDVEETGLGTFRGRLLSTILDEVVIPYHPTGENGETAVGGTAGRIARLVLDPEIAAGSLEGVWWTFTDTEDSAGVPWERSANLRFSPGQLGRAVLGTLRGFQLAEWRLTPDRELQLYNVEGKGRDLTVGANPLTLEHGRDLGDAPRKWRLRGAITDLVTSGKDGLYSSATNATARARRRRRVVGYHSFGNVADQGTLDALTAARLTTMTAGKTEVSHKLALGEGHPTPLLDFLESDYVLSSTKRGVTRRRVRQIVVEGNEDEVVAASATLGVLLDDIAVRQQEQIDALASGEAVAGTSTPPPEVDDGSVPDAPDGAEVVANSLWYANGEGAGLTSVTAAWSPLPDSRVKGYVVEWRYTSAALGNGWQRLPIVEGTSTSWSSVEAGEQLEVRVYAVNKWDRYSPPSSPVWSFVTELDGTPPPTPTAPTPYPALGLGVIGWDGKGVNNVPMPGDFLRAEIHVSTTNGFAAHRPLLASGALDEAASTTYRGEMRGGMELALDLANYGSTLYVVLVAVDRSGNASAQSAQGSLLMRGVQDNEIAALSVSKLTAGILSALVTLTGRLYAGTEGGSGTEMDAAGFRFWSGTGTARKTILDFVASSGALTVLGKLVSGVGVGVGTTVVIETGTTPRILMYPDATQQRFSISANSTTRPDNTTGAAFTLASLNTSGQPDGFSLWTWAQSLWLGHRLPSGAWAGGKLVLERNGIGEMNSNGSAGNPRVSVQAPGAFLATDASQFHADPNGDAYVEANGEITLDTPNGLVVIGRRGGAQNTPVIETDAIIATGRDTAGFSRIKAVNGDAVGFHLQWEQANGVPYWVNDYDNSWVTTGGAIAGRKTFVIPHPDDPERYLVHVATETPEALVEYHGVAEIVGGRADVELPGYFESLTDVDGRTVQATMILPDEPLVEEVPGPAAPEPRPPFARQPDGEPLVVPERLLLHPVAASLPRGGRFRVASPAPDGTRVAWKVTARRRGEPVEVEPLRSENELHGQGPYTFLTPKGTT